MSCGEPCLAVKELKLSLVIQMIFNFFCGTVRKLFSLSSVTMADRGSTFIFPGVVIVTPRPHYPQEEAPVSIEQDGLWALESVWTF